MIYPATPAQAIRVARGLLKQARAAAAVKIAKANESDGRIKRIDRQIAVMKNDIKDLRAKRRQQHREWIEASMAAYEAVKARDRAEAHLDACKRRDPAPGDQPELELTPCPGEENT